MKTFSRSIIVVTSPISTVAIYEATQENNPSLSFYRREFKLGEDCNVVEIHFPSRYPDSGYARNNECDMLVRVMCGEIMFFEFNHPGVSIQKGMTIRIPKETLYYWIDERISGKSSIGLIISTPAWTKKQHETVYLP